MRKIRHFQGFKTGYLTDVHMRQCEADLRDLQQDKELQETESSIGRLRDLAELVLTPARDVVLIYAPHSMIPVLPLALLLQVNLLVRTIYKSGEFVILIILLYEFRR